MRLLHRYLIPGISCCSGLFRSVLAHGCIALRDDPLAEGLRGPGLLAGREASAVVRARESHRLRSLWRLKHEEGETVAVDASIAYFPPAVAAGGGRS